MSAVVVEETVAAKLTATEHPILVVGPDGRELGYFTPASVQARLQLEPQISDEESARRAADPNAKTYTTAEVLAYLEQL